MRIKSILGLVLLVGANYAFAADNVAKEETNPPPAEGALTQNQIPPITTSAKGSLTHTAPAAPQSQGNTAPMESPPKQIIMGQ